MASKISNKRCWRNRENSMKIAHPPKKQKNKNKNKKQKNKNKKKTKKKKTPYYTFQVNYVLIISITFVIDACSQHNFFFFLFWNMMSRVHPDAGFSSLASVTCRARADLASIKKGRLGN